MTADQYITIAILALTFALLIKSKIPPVAVFVSALTLTITFRLAPLNQSLKGFSNPGMLTVGALLMVAAGMYRTCAITLITEKLIGHPKSLMAAQAKILPPVAVGSAFLNNTPPGGNVHSGYSRSCENKSSAGAPPVYSFEFCFYFGRHLYVDRIIHQPCGCRDGD
jgi:hypothetical protein